MKTYDIYIMSSCPYCQKVEKFTNKNNLDVNWLEIHERENYDKLLQLGGSPQVPALLLEDDKILYESDDIINYLGKENDIEVTGQDLESSANFCPIF